MSRPSNRNAIEDTGRRCLRASPPRGGNQLTFLKAIFPVLGGMLIGLIATLILRFMGKFNF